MKVELALVNKAVHFEATAPSSDIKVQIDGSPEIGGESLGSRPMELILMALGSCGSLDLLIILRKQKQVIDYFAVNMDGKRTDKTPSVFTDIHMEFVLKGEIEIAKAERAAELAVKKYCSVYDMLAAGGVNITYSISLNQD